MHRAACLLPLLFAGPAAAIDLNDPSSPLMVEPWIKGGPVHIAEGRGRQTYVLLFFRTTCPHCRKALPVVSKMQQAYADLGVSFVGITAESELPVRKFLDAWSDRVAFPVGLDVGFATNTAYMTAYGDPGVPYAFIIDKTGTIIWRGHPLAGLERRLRRLFPASASRPWVVPPKALIASATRPAGIEKGSAAPFRSAMRVDDARRVALTEQWKTAYAPSEKVDGWLAVRVTFPATVARVPGDGDSATNLHCKAGDWTLADGAGREIAAAGFGHAGDFAGVRECSADMIDAAGMTLKVTSVRGWRDKPDESPTAPPGGPALLEVHTGELSAWVYFPLRAGSEQSKPVGIRFRRSAPIPLPS